MNRILFFYNYNCIEKKVTDTAPYEGLPNVAINPDTTGLELRRVKRQYWKLYEGCVVEKTDDEKKIVDEWHSQNIQTNPDVIEVVKEVIKEVPVETIRDVVRVEIKEIPLEVIKIAIRYKIPLYSWAIMAALLLLNIIQITVRLNQ